MKKKQILSYLLIIFIYSIIGFSMAYLSRPYISYIFNESDHSISMIMIKLVMIMVCVLASFFLQIIIHESGHLVFGSLSGYTFSSFRIGKFMWMNTGDSIQLKRLTLAGTGGQCLMAPPDDWKNTPVFLYNMGGCLMNIISSLLFMTLWYILDKTSIITVFFGITSVIGLAFAFTNGVPLKLSNINNDGSNALETMRDVDARHAFWLQLKQAQMQTQGYRLCEVPEEYFEIPENANMKNSLITTLVVLKIQRMMDLHNFDEALVVIEKVLSIDSGLIGIHRAMLTCDGMYCHLLKEGRDTDVSPLHTKFMNQYFKQMSDNPSVIRTLYAEAALYHNDISTTSKLLEKFEKVAQTYPYTSEIESERELINIVKEKSGF